MDGTEYISVAQRHPQWGFGVFGKTEAECMQNYNDEYQSLCPFGKVGDLLWVRETTEGDGHYSCYSADEKTVIDPFTGSVASWGYPRPSRPSIHMPRWASRLTQRITNVRVERLQDISEEDARAEGCDDSTSEAAVYAGWYEKPRRAFRRLWEQINGTEIWSANPWVWAIEFEVIHTNIDIVLKQEAA